MASWISKRRELASFRTSLKRCSARARSARAMRASRRVTPKAANRATVTNAVAPAPTGLRSRAMRTALALSLVFALAPALAHAEGTPDALKAEIGRPTVEATPSGPDGRAAFSKVLERFGTLVPSSRGIAVRLDAGESGLADVVRALDAQGLSVANLELHQPSLDDVFLAKTGRSLEGHGGDASEPE